MIFSTGQSLYAYYLGEVLFKPTLAVKQQFRPTFEGALSYFVASNNDIADIYQWKPKKNINEIIRDVYNWQKNNIRILKKVF